MKNKGTVGGLPSLSPTVVLAWPDAAHLHRANEMWCYRRGMALLYGIAILSFLKWADYQIPDTFIGAVGMDHH